jgi:hypothetical protein
MGVLRNIEVFEINFAISLSGSLDLIIAAMNPFITLFSLKQPIEPSLPVFDKL